jgi:hypothetical protein
MTTLAPHAQLVERLSRISTRRPRDPFLEIDWDDAANAIDPRDPRWELPPNHPLGATAWYRALPPETRAELGLDITASHVKIGVEFETILNRGLLEFADSLPDDAAETRYAYHELIEECRHVLMFREFLKRAGRGVSGIPWFLRPIARRVDRLGRWWPTLFFVFVIGGEEPIDYAQREHLRPTRTIPPLIRRMMQMHVAEEGRHLCFAQSYLREKLPGAGRLSRAAISVVTPLLLRNMADTMLRPTPLVASRWSIPASVLEEAYGPGSRWAAERTETVKRIRGLFEELGLLTSWSARLWKLAGVA